MYNLTSRFDRDFSRLAGMSPLFADFGRWFQEVDRAFEQQSERATPVLRSQRTDDGYELTVDVPGLTEKGVNLDVHNQVLTLSATRVNVGLEGYTVTRRERPSLQFSQSIRLPEDVNSERVEASMKDGVLTIRLGKRDEVKPRQIKIASS